MIIDCHAHTTNSRLWGLHTELATIEEFEKQAKKFGVVKIILMATYFPFKGSGQHNTKLLQKIKGKPLFSMCASLDLSEPEPRFFELNQVLNEQQVVGIKLYPGYQPVSLQSQKVEVICQLAQKHQVPVVIHSGELHHCCPKNERESGLHRCQLHYCAIDQYQTLSRPKQVVLMAKKFPNVKFVMAHLGNPYFDELRLVMEECPNVWTDISGQLVSGTDEDSESYRFMLNQEILQFLKLPNGQDRLMFGTDFPIQSYQDSLALIKMLRLNQEDEQKVFWKNANRLFNLEVFHENASK